jgi:hypothetical protein
LELQWGGVTDWAIDLVDMYTQPSEEEIAMEFSFDKFNTLDDLAKASDRVPSFCIDTYVLQIMNNDFKTAMSISTTTFSTAGTTANSTLTRSMSTTPCT